MNTISLKTILLNTGFIQDNKYLDLYVELCLNNIATNKEKYKTNAHHVIPVAYYRILNKLNDRQKAETLADKDKNNFKVNLYFKEHLLAHYYLVLCSSNIQFTAAMNSAISFLTGHTKLDISDLKLSQDELLNYQKLYEEALLNKTELVAHKNTGKKRTDATRKKISEANKGKKRTEEVRQHLSEVKKGTHHTEETKRKQSEKMKGCKQPWAGRKQSAEEIERRRQKLLGHEVSDETRQKISLANKGKKNSPETIAKMKATKKEHGPYLVSESTRNKISSNGKGRIVISNPIDLKKKQIHSEQLSYYLDLGWIKGDIKQSMNKKGKSSHTEKKILCLETDEQFNSLKEASTQPGCSCLSRSIKNINLTTNKCHWVYLKEIEHWLTTEVKVIGFEEGINKLAGTLGALICEYKGSTVKVGSGFTDKEREYIWWHKYEYEGKLISVKYFEESYDSKTGQPSLRFPIYKGLRVDL